MAFSQQFSDHLRRQVNEANRHNLELQSLLAHKDDQLAGVNAQLQRALAVSHINTQPSLVQNLQKRNNDFQGQLQHAKQATADAQKKLNDRTKDFNVVWTQQQEQIFALQHKLNSAGIDTKAIVHVGDTSKIVSLEKDLAKANAELQRLRTTYLSLQRQFEAEKKQSEQCHSFPETASHKAGQTHNKDDDMDDEEPKYVFK